MLSPDATPLGLQLYTLRKQMPGRERQLLEAVKNAGYAHVEPMDTEQLQRISPICEELDLRIHSTFYNWTAVTGNQELLRATDPTAVPQHRFGDMIDVAGRQALDYMVFGYMLPQERTTADDYKRRAEQINKAGEQIAAAGMQQVYHHHGFEFKPLDDAKACGWDILLAELDPSLTLLQIDTFWAQLAGQDLTQIIMQNLPRICMLHLKDLGYQGMPHYDELSADDSWFQALGDGHIEFETLLAQLSKSSVKHLIVEQDYSKDALQAIIRSIDTFRSYNF